MSLHLIESTKIQTVANRKRGGTVASVFVHSLLVVGVFTAASAAPAPEEARKVNTAIYVAPAPPPTAKPLHSTLNAAGAAPDKLPSITMPTMPDITNINIDVPTVSTEITIDMSIRDFSNQRGTVGGTDGGTGDRSGTSAVATNGVLSDLQVDKPVVALSGYRTPRYPEAMRATGIEETLTALFVVDTLGRIEPGSLEIQNAQHQPFIQAVRDALANARFRAAEVQGRRVRQRVMQSFVFSLSLYYAKQTNGVRMHADAVYLSLSK